MMFKQILQVATIENAICTLSPVLTPFLDLLIIENGNIIGRLDCFVNMLIQLNINIRVLIILPRVKLDYR